MLAQQRDFMGNEPTYLSGSKTVTDWLAARESLNSYSGDVAWAKVYQDYFRDRLELRYLKPIRILQTHGSLRGEGFAIVAIQCSLIEFLESTVQGTKYRYLRHNERLRDHEYSSSGDVFVKFLCERDPFKSHFDKALAEDFYKNVRCGVLHEARTRNGWRVWAGGVDSPMISREQKVIYRDGLQAGLLSFIDWYGNALLERVEFRDAFIRKFDDLCE
jgi:hypothetical protein